VASVGAALGVAALVGAELIGAALGGRAGAGSRASLVGADVHLAAPRIGGAVGSLAGLTAAGAHLDASPGPRSAEVGPGWALRSAVPPADARSPRSGAPRAGAGSHRAAVAAPGSKDMSFGTGSEARGGAKVAGLTGSSGTAG